MSNTEDTTVENEQAADLAALRSALTDEAPSTPGAASAEPAPAGPQPPSAAALQIAGLVVGMGRPIVAFAVPQLRGAPDDLWEPVPEGIAAVLDHYGASADWMQSPWARLAISLAPLVAFAAVSAMREQPRAEAAGAAAPVAVIPAPAPAPAPSSSKTVQFGTVHAEGAAS